MQRATIELARRQPSCSQSLEWIQLRRVETETLDEPNLGYIEISPVQHRPKALLFVIFFPLPW